MSSIAKAKAYPNNEIVLIAWEVPQMIPDCRGFEITRLYKNGTEKVLAAWVPFDGQSNPKWIPQTTSLWPVQKLIWRDLTVRQRRDQLALHPADESLRYRIRPLVTATAGKQPVTAKTPDDAGPPVPLSYYDEGVETNEVTVTSQMGKSVRATFTNGILAAQWLKHALESIGEKLNADTVRKHIADKDDKIRKYLMGDVFDTLTSLFAKADAIPSAKIYLCLYELSDRALVDTLIANKHRIEVILSNSSKPRNGDEWDSGNHPFRQELIDNGVSVQSRYFNNSRIGHNKFAVLVAGGKAKALMTGSTNWTSTGLCGQSNNAITIESPELADAYFKYWKAIAADTEDFDVPNPYSEATRNAQGHPLRTWDATPQDAVTLDDGTRITPWFSPNTPQITKGKAVPPDLAAIYSKMRKAEHAIFFACFLPSRAGKTSIIAEAIDIELKDPDLLVYGAISDPTAMPNYDPPAKDENGDEDAPKYDAPATYVNGRMHVIRAAALTEDDLVGEFEAELLKTGNAIIHDKVVVVDPLSADGFVVLGSHNLGFKASYENDENLLIVENNPALIQAYAVHILDLFEHYNFRAVQHERERQAHADDKPDVAFSGFLSKNDRWLKRNIETSSGDLARYFAQG